jgi:hypothetical protein
MYSKISFNCPICFEDYNDNSEIILECSHKLCLTCYQKIINMVKLKMILCPFCRANIKDNNIIIYPNENSSLRNVLRDDSIQESNCVIIINFLIDKMKFICCSIIFILLIITVSLYGHK